MKLTDLFTLLGGLALFLYGMKMMSDGLEVAAGKRLKGILERLTSHRLLGVLVGAGITAVIQSSSATTVMVVGFVNSGLMTLTQAVGVIMGANIGTTITGQLIALDIGALAPIIAFGGVAVIMFVKNKKAVCIGSIVAGLGILFIGMDLMSASMAPLRDSPAFINMMTNFSNPILGILAGALFTAIIQSSSASVGILQALAMSGLIGLDSAVYVLFGQNIGTCITAVLASIGTNKNAKRTTIIHLLFNVIGTIIFVIICMTTPFTTWMQSFAPTNAAAQIANVHTIFNITTTLILLPFGNLLAKLAMKILPGDDYTDTERKLIYVEDHSIGSTAIAITQVEQEVTRMMKLASENVQLAFSSILAGNDKNLHQISDNEDYLDFLNTEISRYISKVSAVDMSDSDSDSITTLYKITGNIERIGDHAMNMAEYTTMLSEKQIAFSEETNKEISSMQDLILPVLKQLTFSGEIDAKKMLQYAKTAEQKMDDMNRLFRKNQIHRMQNDGSSVESGIIYSEMLTDIERISDHFRNIAEDYAHMKGVLES